VTPQRELQRESVKERIHLAPLKGDARAGYPASHPYRLAVEALPDSVSRDAYLAQLPILLSLARVREDP
jgi:hypothetical protein